MHHKIALELNIKKRKYEPYKTWVPFTVFYTVHDWFNWCVGKYCTGTQLYMYD